VGALALAACAPALQPLSGVPVPARLPAAELPPARQLVVFRWELHDGELVARGDGAARLAPPDSARLDFFVAGGMGSGAAVLIGDSLRLPATNFTRRLVPAPPLLWAALGRLDLPALADTVARVDGSVLRADIGSPVQWRVTFAGTRLQRLERVAGGRVLESVDRAASGQVSYRQERDHRTLALVITKVDEVAPFDSAIWTFP
jgi:hypothetical protein